MILIFISNNGMSKNHFKSYVTKKQKHFIKTLSFSSIRQCFHFNHLSENSIFLRYLGAS